MSPDRTYRWLIEASAPNAGDGFDAHVCASMLALAIAQAREENTTLAATSGLDAAALSALAARLFPGAARPLAAMAGAAAPAPSAEEESARDLLLMYGNGDYALLHPLAVMIARRCQEPHHLWQDLGLRNRGELSELMTRHFTRLKQKNSADMKWKKFISRMVCASEGFSLCPAPVCSDCDDFASCFGSEEGISRLAHIYEQRA
ncbi:nitrogen fixation protein NifQ [Rhodoblastus acidophilus]|uniref:nitrogen fixation protein NifQ n=1 Tax=Rhodoblastus acidophilus TaxID=1074 RepID=UPI0022254A67|nr:nitrogen fixation protein NifQ [Rhodoblastus acidophilus]MCW2316085.1 nitrogen fixation protein NifQ [Rhodoblastus acidophilus]